MEIKAEGTGMLSTKHRFVQVTCKHVHGIVVN
jgi:hypothetical protein